MSATWLLSEVGTKPSSKWQCDPRRGTITKKTARGQDLQARLFPTTQRWMRPRYCNLNAPPLFLTNTVLIFFVLSHHVALGGHPLRRARVSHSSPSLPHTHADKHGKGCRSLHACLSVYCVSSKNLATSHPSTVDSSRFCVGPGLTRWLDSEPPFCTRGLRGHWCTLQC